MPMRKTVGQLNDSLENIKKLRDNLVKSIDKVHDERNALIEILRRIDVDATIRIGDFIESDREETVVNRYLWPEKVEEKSNG